MNFKSFRHILTICAYSPCSTSICLMLFFTSIGILISSFSLSLYFFIKSPGKVSDYFKKLLFYNFVYYPRLSCIYFVSLFKCVNIFNINVHCLFICLLLLFKINFRIVASLGFCNDGFIDICLFSHRQIVSI